MNTRTLLRVTITLESRWAVGGVGVGTREVDLPVLIDPRVGTADGNRPHIPGSSLAGSLRAHLGDLGLLWLGREPVEWETATGTLTPVPSRLSILGTQPIVTSTHTRGSTAIDGSRGAALTHALRTEQWAAPTDLVVAMQHRGVPDEALLVGLSSWRPTIGRGRSTGMGRGVAVCVEALTVDLSEPNELTWWLTSRSDWLLGLSEPPHNLNPRVIGPPGVPEPIRYVLELPWVVREPVHVGGSDDERPGGPTRPALTMRVGDTWVVPGSSWKGVFRHRVETILAAIAMADTDRAAVTATLFGTLEQGRGLLTFSDAQTPRGWSSVTRTHVAIDRFTGGSRDGALFQVEAIGVGAPLPLSITISPPAESPVRTLLLHVARDLHEGLVSVGGHGTRGYGWVKLDPADLLADLGPVDAEALLALLPDSSPSHAQVTS